MNKILIAGIITFGCLIANAQSAMDGFNISQPDLKGTARFMGMGGAFGALGGDLSSISQNPAGIGVYRSSDIGFTLDLDCQRSVASAQGSSNDMTQTKFLLNNIGAVVTLRLPSNSIPNLNLGFTYNKGASFNRQYGGLVPNLYNSLSNYIAGIANHSGLSEGDVATDPGYYDPYINYNVPWFPILGYDGYLITPSVGENSTNWFGQWGNGTSGSGAFRVQESGGIDEYNIAFGGNISNVVYWGMNFDITNLNYTMKSIWAENLEDAYVPDENNRAEKMSARWDLSNYYNVAGTGFEYSIGVIVKPIQELRLGLAFHTPTWYNLTESYSASIDYNYAGYLRGTAYTNNGEIAFNDVKFRTPMRLIASAAGVIGQNFIISFDYEWTPYNKMKYSEPSSYYGGYYDGPFYDDWPYFMPEKSPQRLSSSEAGILDSDDPYYLTNNDIRTYYQSTNTFRIGAEYKVVPSFSIRVGYSHVSSPVKSEAKNNMVEIGTSGTIPNYRFDNSTNYITCGLGYRYQHFYADLTYVYKHMGSTYHAYPNDVMSNIPSPQSKLSFTNNQIVLSAGFRF